MLAMAEPAGSQQREYTPPPRGVQGTCSSAPPAKHPPPTVPRATASAADSVKAPPPAPPPAAASQVPQTMEWLDGPCPNGSTTPSTSSSMTIRKAPPPALERRALPTQVAEAVSAQVPQKKTKAPPPIRQAPASAPPSEAEGPTASPATPPLNSSKPQKAAPACVRGLSTTSEEVSSATAAAAVTQKIAKAPPPFLAQRRAADPPPVPPKAEAAAVPSGASSNASAAPRTVKVPPSSPPQGVAAQSAACPQVKAPPVKAAPSRLEPCAEHKAQPAVKAAPSRPEPCAEHKAPPPKAKARPAALVQAREEVTFRPGPRERFCGEKAAPPTCRGSPTYKYMRVEDNASASHATSNTAPAPDLPHPEPPTKHSGCETSQTERFGTQSLRYQQEQQDRAPQEEHRQQPTAFSNMASSPSPVCNDSQQQPETGQQDSASSPSPECNDSHQQPEASAGACATREEQRSAEPSSEAPPSPVRDQPEKEQEHGVDGECDAGSAPPKKDDPSGGNESAKASDSEPKSLDELNQAPAPQQGGTSSVANGSNIERLQQPTTSLGPPARPPAKPDEEVAKEIAEQVRRILSIKAKTRPGPDWYEVLELTDSFTKEALKAKRIQLLKVLHADKYEVVLSELETLEVTSDMCKQAYQNFEEAYKDAQTYLDTGISGRRVPAPWQWDPWAQSAQGPAQPSRRPAQASPAAASPSRSPPQAKPERRAYKAPPPDPRPAEDPRRPCRELPKWAVSMSEFFVG